MTIRPCLLLAAFLAVTGPAVALAQTVTGAGSSFAEPLYTKWGEAARPDTGVRLNYQAIGSGAGQTQVRNRVVDFGATDVPLPPDQLTGAHLLQFPTALGAVDVVVNLPGVDHLRLTGGLLAAIYKGELTSWRDARIAAANPGVTLPDTDIAPVYRADGSGTTEVFTRYLSKVSPDWREAVGANVSIRWPAGTGARGNDGIAATVQSLPGAIGYVEASYASAKGLRAAELRNAAGQWVSPDAASFAAAAAAADWSGAEDFAVDLTDGGGDRGWPMMSATYVLLPTDDKDKARTDAVLRLFQWGFEKGGALATELGYVPLPAEVQARVRAAWQHDFSR